jgi:hypothetical protein
VSSLERDWYVVRIHRSHVVGFGTRAIPARSAICTDQRSRMTGRGREAAEGLSSIGLP